MTEMTLAGPPVEDAARPHDDPAPGFWPRVGYLLAGLPLGVAAFAVAVAGFVLGVSTLVVWLGVPVLAATLWACRGLSTVERRSTERVTGRDLPPHHYRVAVPGAGRPAVSLAMVRDPQAWRDVLHAVIAFPVRLAAAVLVVAWGVGGLGGLFFVAWEWALPDDRHGLSWLVTGTTSRPAEIVVNTVLGAVALALLPWLVRALVALRAGLARGLLTNQTAALRARADELAAGRRAAVAAEATTLRRLERDLHDGPQQRLVRMTIDLEATSRRLDDDPERARPLLDEAITQSREALAELRALSRGIAPPVLADRGLDAALGAAAARSPLPVTLHVAVPARLPAAVETTAYYVVTEALTNVAKHADASQATVTAVVDDDRLVVSVADDGRGGAHSGKGHGLAGLADRVATVDGTLAITSPAGGPTVLTASLPVREG
ncbi:sensor histidine kinase [Actinomycetospora sp. C-140]